MLSKRMTENSRLLTAAPAIRHRIMTRSRPRVLRPVACFKSCPSSATAMFAERSSERFCGAFSRARLIDGVRHMHTLLVGASFLRHGPPHLCIHERIPSNFPSLRYERRQEILQAESRASLYLTEYLVSNAVMMEKGKFTTFLTPSSQPTYPLLLPYTHGIIHVNMQYTMCEKGWRQDSEHWHCES